MSLIVAIILIVVGFLGVGAVEDSGCSSDGDGCATVVTVSAWTLVEIDGVSGVIVTKSDGALFLDADRYWTPAEADVSAGENAIEAEQGDFNHLRQYVGFIEDGERKLLVVGFANDLEVDWLSQPVLVDDGGDAFFEAVYNVDTAELEWFSYHGVA